MATLEPVKTGSNPTSSTSFLDVIEIRSPCTMDWDLMTGDERTRHCGKCRKNVYNLSEMSERDAVKLIQDSGEKICGRIYRRPDGTVLTNNCPKRNPKRGPLQYSLAALVILLTASSGVFAAAPWVGKKIQPWLDQLTADSTVGSQPTIVVMGEMIAPPILPPTASSQREAVE